MLRRLSPALFLCAALAGCGGGGGSSIPAPLQKTLTGGGTTPLSVAVSITIPAATAASSARQRRPLYVSSNTNSAAVSVDGGKAVIANLSAGSLSCAPVSGGRACSISVSAAAGTHTFAVSLFASTDGTGVALSANTISAAVVAGTANVVKLILDGIVASIVITLANPNPPAGTAATSLLTVNLNDASGASIVGSDPLVNPVTLTDSDASGVTKLSKTTIASPADAANLSLAYTGGTLTQAVIGATAGTPSPTVTTATFAPQQASSSALVDWPSYGYDIQRTGYNPYTTGITPASISNIHLAWQIPIHGSTQSQPIVVTNVAGHQALLIIAEFANAQAYDALTGKLVWSQKLPTQDVQDCGIGGISGTAQYDKALGAIFMAAGNGAGAPNHVILYKLDVGTGNILGNVDVTPTLLPGEGSYSHSGVAMANGRIYLGTGSDCEGTKTGKYPSWRGRVVAVDPSSMTLLNTFYTTWNQGGTWGGGGVWAWGGVSSDTNGNVFASTGNGETAESVLPQNISAPFAAMPAEFNGYADQLVELTADISRVENSNYPGFNFTIGGRDLDYTGVPVVVEPAATTGCGEYTATQGKGGELVINNTQNLGVVKTYNLSVPTAAGYFMGNPGYSPSTGFVYSPIPTSGNGSAMYPPGLAAIGNCGSAIAWTTQFGPDSAAYSGDAPRSAPTITAGGVVFIGTPCTNNGNGGCGSPGVRNGALWAIDATKGTVLGGGKPLVITGDNIRMAPSADGLWVWLLDGSGNLYGLTVDPSVATVAAQKAERVTSALRIHDTH